MGVLDKCEINPTPLLEQIVNTINNHKQYPLHVATRFGSYDAIAILIKAGGDVNLGVKNGRALDGLIYRQKGIEGKAIEDMAVLGRIFHLLADKLDVTK